MKKSAAAIAALILISTNVHAKGLPKVSDLKDAFKSQSKSAAEDIEEAFSEITAPGKDAIGEIGTVVDSFSKAAEDITPENEYYIGRSVAANILSNYKTAKNPKLETYLNSICTALVLNSEDPNLFNGYHVKILESDEINAFSTSGGHIFITKGLIACTDSEDTLAAVIAHEIAHIQLKHSVKSIKANRFNDALLTSASVTSDALGMEKLSKSMEGAAGDAYSSLVNSGFSQTQEFEADKAALKLMADAGYDPKAMVTMLEKMKKAQTSAPKTGFYKTHPSPASRIGNVKAYLNKYKVKDSKSYRTERYTKATSAK